MGKVSGKDSVYLILQRGLLLSTWLGPVWKVEHLVEQSLARVHGARAGEMGTQPQAHTSPFQRPRRPFV